MEVETDIDQIYALITARGAPWPPYEERLVVVREYLRAKREYLEQLEKSKELRRDSHG